MEEIHCFGTSPHHDVMFSTFNESFRVCYKKKKSKKNPSPPRQQHIKSQRKILHHHGISTATTHPPPPWTETHKKKKKGTSEPTPETHIKPTPEIHIRSRHTVTMPLPRRDHSESNSAPVASFERERERDVREGLRTED